MRKVFLGLAVSVLSLPAFAQEVPTITPVWEYFNISENSPLPILTVTAPDTRTQGDAGQGEGPLDGTATNDSYGGFKRYDESRLVLGIRENGIDETDPNHDAATAALFPDRSLVWINPADGSSSGVALVVGHTPVAVSDEFVALQVSNGRDLNGGVGPAEYFNFGVSDDGVIYVGYYYFILSYTPDGNGGFTGPEIAYTFNDGENPGLDRWDQWRFEDIEVSGSGTDTIIIAGGKTWRPEQSARWLTTEDGVNFTVVDIQFGGGGGNSKLLNAPDGDTYVYHAQYPGSGGGPGNTFTRFLFDGLWIEDELFSVQMNEEADGIEESKGDYIHDVEIHPELPEYIFSLASPSYGGEALPGWINMMSQTFDGTPSTILTSHKHDVLKVDELFTADLPIWFGTMGDLEVNRLEGFPDGAAEILWYSGLYGYGRYTIGAVPSNVNSWSLF